MTTGKAVTGILVGLAAGALLGVLFAPDKGSNTRKKIGQKKDDAIDDMKSKLDELVKGFSAKLQTAKEEAGNILHKTNNHIDEVRKIPAKA